MGSFIRFYSKVVIIPYRSTYKRVLPFSYMQDLHLKVASLSHDYLKVEEYIMNFEKLQMRCLGGVEANGSKVLKGALIYNLFELLTNWKNL